MRKVLVFSTKSNTTTPVETSATNWGELSSYLTSKNLFNASGMKAVVKETRSTLELKEAVLPDGDFVLILIPTKNESGAKVIKVEDLDEFIEDQLENFRDNLNDFVEDNQFDEETDPLVAEAEAIKAELGIL